MDKFELPIGRFQQLPVLCPRFLKYILASFQRPEVVLDKKVMKNNLKTNRKAVSRNVYNQKPNPAIKTKMKKKNK